MRYWIALELTVVPILGFLAAWPFWRNRAAIFGNIVGTGVILGSAIALILREYFQIDRVVRACFDAGTTCFPEPSAFVRFAIYASIGMVEVFALFTISLRVERRIRNRDYAPEWR
jgi:cytosine/uracil/thiamine/allantoin permease